MAPTTLDLLMWGTLLSVCSGSISSARHDVPSCRPAATRHKFTDHLMIQLAYSRVENDMIGTSAALPDVCGCEPGTGWSSTSGRCSPTSSTDAREAATCRARVESTAPDDCGCKSGDGWSSSRNRCSSSSVTDANEAAQCKARSALEGSSCTPENEDPYSPVWMPKWQGAGRSEDDACCAGLLKKLEGRIWYCRRSNEYVQQPQARVPALATSPGLCRVYDHCTVPVGETWVLNASMHVKTLTIEGTLQWDTSKDGLELRAGYVLVKSGGILEVGTKESPMIRTATIHITKSAHTHPEMGNRFLGGVGNSIIRIHGRKLERTWTLLSQTAPEGATKLYLKHDPVAMGWKAGDRIGLATTSRGQSTVHRIKKVEPSVLVLERGIPHEYWGGFRTVEGRQFEMAAEIVNLERSVLITGDHDDFFQSKQGLHTKHGGRGGLFDVRYTRVEWCGQRDVLGRYCLHFHMMGHCPACAFQGNAVVESQQVGITVHGTHDSSVDQNILWDTRGAGIYIEGGNEMNNTLSENVAICSEAKVCAVNWQRKGNQFAGIYMIGMTNHVLHNHVAGWEHGIWTPGANRQQGQGAAHGKVCPMHTPFGRFKGNVVHDCNRFGLYLDNQYPRNLKRDEDGMVTDMASCQEFTSDGRDNGLVPANVVEDEFDWHNLFVGQYSLGDVGLVRYTSINNHHPIYWKDSKNFADGKTHHIRDSLFLNDPTDRYGVLQFLGPSGPFTFTITNTTFAGSPVGCGAICAGQHCGRVGAGGPCNAQYLLEKVDLSGVGKGGRRVKFGINSFDPGFVLPVFLSNDDSLGGYKSLVSQHLNGFGQVPGCQKTDRSWDNAYGCTKSVRRFNIWTRDVGSIRVSGPGYDVPANYNKPVHGLNAGYVPYEPRHGGYGMPVIAGEQYSIQGDVPNDAVLEFSDKQVAKRFDEAEEVQVRAFHKTCRLSAMDDRPFIGAKGIKPPRGQTMPTAGCTKAR